MGISNTIKVSIINVETKKSEAIVESVTKAAKWLKIYDKNINHLFSAGKPIAHAHTKKLYILKEVN